MDRVKEMANFLVEGIRFTVDIPERYANRQEAKRRRFAD